MPVKTALVTGAANGIGLEIARSLGVQGARVGLIDVDETALETACHVVDNAVPLVGSVASESDVSDAFDAFGDTPELVVNNAGIVRFGPLSELSVDDFRTVIDINLMGVYIVTREATQRMRHAGRGQVISLTSINAYSPGPGAGAYPPSKSAVLQLMKQFALENAEYGLRYNSIAPGFIDGGMSTPIYADPKVRAARTKGVPQKRLGTPQDIASAVLFLASEEASYINGHDLVVDGAVTHAILKNLPRA
ncbi:MAG: SDR family NAD(P)-dependent oxidoreductase [Pseudomonadota bacterium]